MSLIDPGRCAEFLSSGRLPQPQGIALAMTRLLRSRKCRVADVVALLQADPAMARLVVRFFQSIALAKVPCNGAVATAVLALGTHRVRDLVLGFSILQANCRTVCNSFNVEVFRARAVATAVAALAMTRRNQIAETELFVVGLLCDIGTLGLAADDCGRYCEALDRADGDCARMIEAERSLFGTDHRELGAAMMLDWGLPNTLVGAVYHSEAPDLVSHRSGSRHRELTRSLCFARAFAKLCVAKTDERWCLLPELYAQAAGLGIEPDELESLGDDIVNHWRDWGAVLELQTQNVPSFSELLSAVPPSEVAETVSAQRIALIIGVEEPEAGRVISRLTTRGYSVTVVAKAIDGLLVLLRDRPHLIIVGLASAELDGAAFCRAFRANPQSRDSHLILMGEGKFDDGYLGALHAGGDDYVVWPCNTTTLRAKLRAADKIAHMRKEIHRERRLSAGSDEHWAGSRQEGTRSIDPLTQLPGRDYGLALLAAEWTFAHTDSWALSCLMVDIDHLTAINDSFGQRAGDAVLACVAQLLVGLCRSQDVPFCYGDGKFCIVCADTRLPAARIMAQRIREGVEKESYTGGHREIMATVSIGIAAIAPMHDSPDALIRDAFGALDRAKQKGRNHVEG